MFSMRVERNFCSLVYREVRDWRGLPRGSLVLRTVQGGQRVATAVWGKALVRGTAL